MSEKTQQSKDLLSAMVREYVLWMFTALTGFFGYSVWSMSGSIHELVVQVQHLAETRVRDDGRIETLERSVGLVRDEQLRRSQYVGDFADLDRRLANIEKQLRDLHNVTD